MKAIVRKKYFNIVIRLLIFMAAYLYIYYQLSGRVDLESTWEYFVSHISLNMLMLSLGGIGLMMVLNWSAEAIKWRYLLRRHERIPFLTAFRAVWAGVTVSTLTPGRTGEYFGRVFMLKNTNPWEGAFMTIVGSFSQLLVTVIAGSVGLILFILQFASAEVQIPVGLSVAIILLAGLVVAALLVLYFNVWFMESLLLRLTPKRWTKFREPLRVFATYSRRELLVVLLLSIFRYAVFSLQFFFLLRLFMVPIPLADGLIIISAIYLLLSVFPNIALTEIGVRGSLVVFFLDIYFADHYLAADTAGLGGIAAASVLWVINLVIPALIGGIFVWQLKFFRK